MSSYIQARRILLEPRNCGRFSLNLRSGLSYYLRPCTVELVAEKERERFAPMQLARRYGGDGGAWTDLISNTRSGARN